MKDTIMEAVGAVAAGRNRKYTLRKAGGFIYDEGPGFESHPATKSCLRAAYFDCWYCYYSYLFRLIFFNSSKTFNTGASPVRLSGIKGSSSGLKAIRAGSDKSI